jgi:hypothetical protein
MLKKQVTFTDFNGNSRTEDFYFNLTKAEIAEMEVSVEGGFVGFIERIIAEQDQKNLVAIFQEIVLSAYGVKSPDGREFIKNDEVRAMFKQTQAYSDIFIELATNAEAATAFFEGIIPNMD